MKNKLFRLVVTAIALCSFPGANFGQAPTLGTAANFVLYTTVGAVTNTGISHLTGNVGTNVGSSTGFGNVDGGMHDQDAASAQCSTDLLLAYGQLNSAVATFFPAPLLGNGQVLNAGVYSIAAPATLNSTLILDGQGNPNALFIFKIQAAFATNASAKVRLINGALACNVFWKVEGQVSIGTGTSMKGTIVANNAAIALTAGDTLEGRALSLNGAVTLDGLLGYTPIGCLSPFLTGPAAPPLGTTACFDLFSSDGPVTNSGVTFVTGDIGTNVGTTTGFLPIDVTGNIHAVPDGATGQCATDLGTVYTFLNTLPIDILLLYPAQFGHNLVLTPHTYRMNGATTFTDTLYLNAEGNANAVFVIQIKGALSTSTFSNVVLINGTQAKNIYWNVDGAVNINDHSIFNGTIICNNGAISLNTGVLLNGRALTTNGALATLAITASVPSNSGPAGNISGLASVCAGQTGVIYSVPAITNATGYNWTLPAGATITAGANTDSITVSFGAAASSGNITVQGNTGCGNGSISSNFAVTVNQLPGAPGIISGPAVVCQGQTGVVYSIPPIPNATGYNWTLPAGATITTGLNTNTFTVTFGPTAVNDNITVSGTNSCGTGPSSANFPITVNPLPSAPGTITGTSSVCPGQTGVVYSIPPVANATGYTWALPAGATITAGLNTNSITVSFGAGALSGNITVAGTDGCGTGTPSANFAVNINTVSPAGLITGSSNVCPGQTGVIYSVPAATNATGYNWTLPAGASITSGLNTNSITVSFSAIAVSGNIAVQGTNVCGSGTSSANFAVNVGSASASGPISGSPLVCQGQTAVLYTVAPITGATGYNWVLPAGASVATGLNTDSITVDFSVTATSGTITVQGTSACGNGTISANFAVTVNPLPGASGPVTGPLTACQGETGVIYSVPSTGNATGYAWTLPAGVTITAGLNTNSITVSFATNATNGVISVQGTNGCGKGTASANLAVTVNPLPAAAGPINGPLTTCEGQTGVIYSVSLIANASGYIWTIPAGVTITAGNNTNAITVNFSNLAANGTITVQGSNACGNGTVSANFNFTVNPLPSAAGPISGPATVCSGQTGVIYSIPAVSNATGYTWSVPSGATITSGANTDSITVSFSAAAVNGMISVEGTNGCGNGIVSSNFAVTVNTTPVASATSNSPVCSGGSLELMSQTVAGGTYSWTGPLSYSSSLQNPVILVASVTNAGNYSLSVSANGCTSVPSVVAIAVVICDSADLSVVKSVDNVHPIIGRTVVFTITASNKGPNDATGVAVNDILQSGYTFVSSTETEGSYDPSTGVWTIGNLPARLSYVLKITAKVVAGGNYQNTAIIYGNLPDGDMTNNNSTIETFPTDFNIPEGFSPNGDGINDEFVIRGLDSYSKNTFVIFNRWGDQVFEASPYQNNWAGQSAKGIRVGGDVLPVGTYFYVLDLGDGSAIYKGTIYLNK